MSRQGDEYVLFPSLLTSSNHIFSPKGLKIAHKNSTLLCEVWHTEAGSQWAALPATPRTRSQPLGVKGECLSTDMKDMQPWACVLSAVWIKSISVVMKQAEGHFLCVLGLGYMKMPLLVCRDCLSHVASKGKTHSTGLDAVGLTVTDSCSLNICSTTSAAMMRTAKPA